MVLLRDAVFFAEVLVADFLVLALVFVDVFLAVVLLLVAADVFFALVLDFVALQAADLALVLHGSALAAYAAPGSKLASAIARGTKVVIAARFQKNTIRLSRQKGVRDRAGQGTA